MITHDGYDLSDLDDIKESLFYVLQHSTTTPQEIDIVIAAIDNGHIHGEYYFSADKQCGCLLGTLALSRLGDEIEWDKTTNSFYEHQFLDEANVYNQQFVTQFEKYIIDVEYGQTHLTSNELANTREWLLEYKESIK